MSDSQIVMGGIIRFHSQGGSRDRIRRGAKYELMTLKNMTPGIITLEIRPLEFMTLESMTF